MAAASIFFHRLCFFSLGADGRNCPGRTGLRGQRSAIDFRARKIYYPGMTKSTHRRTGSAIRLGRERMGWSQTDLARRIGLSTRTIAAWERGQGPRRGIAIDTVDELCSLLGLLLSDFGIER